MTESFFDPRLAREIARTAFFDSQKKAPDNYWYVPYKTGVMLSGSVAKVVTHLGRAPDPHPLDTFEFFSPHKIGLVTTGVYDCLSLLIEVEPLVTVLIHAHGARSLVYLLREVQRQLPELSATKLPKEIHLAYNPWYLANMITYELVCLDLHHNLKPAKVHRQWVDELTIIKPQKRQVECLP